MLVCKGGIAHLTVKKNRAQVHGHIGAHGNYGRDWKGVFDPVQTNFSVAKDSSSDSSSLDSAYKGGIFRRVECVAHQSDIIVIAFVVQDGCFTVVALLEGLHKYRC